MVDLNKLLRDAERQTSREALKQQRHRDEWTRKIQEARDRTMAKRRREKIKQLESHAPKRKTPKDWSGYWPRSGYAFDTEAILGGMEPGRWYTAHDLQKMIARPKAIVQHVYPAIHTIMKWGGVERRRRAVDTPHPTAKPVAYAYALTDYGLEMKERALRRIKARMEALAIIEG